MGSAIEHLICCYRNERNTEEILPYAEEVVNFYSAAIPNHINYINSLNNTILKSINEQELERTKYFLKEYLLVRKRKIASRMVINKEFLSEKECSFFDEMVDFYKNNDVFVEEEFLNEEVVGFISNTSDKNIVLDGRSVPLRKDDFYIANIKDVINHLHSNDVDLI